MDKHEKTNTNVIYSYYPAKWHKNLWREGFCAGNGKTGVIACGAICNDFLVITRADLWYGLKTAELPDVSDSLKRMRDLRMCGKFKEANAELCNALKEKGYSAACSSPLPIGQLNVTAENGGYFTDYVRTLDTNSGEITCSWTKNGAKFRKRAFVSQINDLIFLEISCGEAANFAFSLTERDDSDSRFPCPEDLKNQFEYNADNGRLSFYGKNSDGKFFGCTALVKSDGAACAEGNRVRVKGAKNLLVIAKAFSNETRLPDDSLLRLLECAGDYDEEFKPHAEAFFKLYGGTELSLYRGKSHSVEELLLSVQRDEITTEIIEKLYRYGRYLFVSGTARGGLPFSQYGIWAGDYSAVWSQNVLNENLELIYEHVFSGNLIDSLPSVFDYFENNLDEYRLAAKRLFGCRGIAIHAYSCPETGAITVNVPVITNWTGAGAWIASFYYRYYEYTGDRTFLTTRALPFLREVCLFYIDFLYYNGNKIEIYPSVSPENSPANFADGGDTLSHPMPTAINATMDVALIKNVFKNYLTLCEAADTVAEEKGKISEILGALPDYLTENGAFKEWCYKDFKENHDHRHFSHLYPLWPGDEITRESRFYDACAKTLELRTKNGLQHQSGWSLTHLACLYSRLNNGEKAFDCLKFLLKGDLLNNFFTVHNDWRGMGLSMHEGDACTVQLDANMGYVSAIQEMLIRCANGKIEILPALPNHLFKGKVKNLRVTDGTVCIVWDRQKSTLKIVTNSALPLELPTDFKNVSVKNYKKSVICE